MTKNDQYRASSYLNVINLEEGETNLLLNGVNGCLDEVPEELGEILSSGHESRINMLSISNIDFLKKRGHITKLSPKDELERFKEFVSALHTKRQNNISSGGLLFLLSYNCNLACKYCYQQKHRPHKSNVTMTPEMVDEILHKHLTSILPGIKVKQLSFYGGEPFLFSNLTAINRVLEYAKKFDIRIEAISNATMVDEMIDIFGPEFGKVNRVQISLDGDRDQHDISRIPLSGAPTFDKIIGNIKLILDRGTKVSIRLNLDKKKIETTPKLLEYLKSEKIVGHKNVIIYATPLHDNLCEVDAGDFMDINGLAEKVFKFGIDLEHPVSVRTNDMRHIFNLKQGLGLTKTSYCMQTMQKILVVDPFGDLYACFEEAGYPEMRIGHVGHERVEFFPLSDVYKKRHLTNMSDCLACSVALACGGQCGVMSRSKTGDLFKPYCGEMKEVILRGLKLAYKKYKSEGRNSEGGNNVTMSLDTENNNSLHG